MALREYIERTKRGLDRTIDDADRVAATAQRFASRLSSSESDPVGKDTGPGSGSGSGMFGSRGSGSGSSARGLGGMEYFSGEFSRVQPDAGAIEDYVRDYDECPLVSTPVDNYTSDVMAPGIRIETSDTELEDALLDFCSTAAILAGEFDHDFADLLEDLVRDSVVRGTGFAEIAYADRKTAEEIKGFRLLRAETLTPYTRPGQAILLKPDDSPAPRVEGGQERSAPKTAAGKTAAYVQYDSVFASTTSEDEIAFAQDDAVKVSNRPETGAIFGRSDIEAVHSRVRGLLQKLEDVDTAIAAKAYAFWLIKIGADGTATEEDIEQAKAFMAEQEPENYGPGKKQAVPNTVSLETFSGEVPEVWESLEFDVKYILSQLPTPKYRTGWEDDINRDIALREQEDYREEVRAMRRSLEAKWQPVLERVAIQKGFGSEEEPPEFEFLIEEQRDTNPLRAEWFDAETFRATMQGLEVAAPNGEVDRIVPPETILDWLGQDPEKLLGNARGIPDEVQGIDGDADTDSDADETGIEPDTDAPMVATAPDQSDPDTDSGELARAIDATRALADGGQGGSVGRLSEFMDHSDSDSHDHDHSDDHDHESATEESE